MFGGEKTDIFWSGLIFSALGSVTLFAMIWFNGVIVPYNMEVTKYQVPFIVGAVVFIIVGLLMMTSGIRKNNA